MEMIVISMGRGKVFKGLCSGIGGRPLYKTTTIEERGSMSSFMSYKS